MTSAIRDVTIDIPELGSVSGLLRRPSGAIALFVLGHGAGAGMRHPFMEGIADRLAGRTIATLRYQFPYMEAGKKRPDHARRLEATVRAACAAATELASGAPLIAGGKSMGGRMSSQAQASAPLPGVVGLAFLGFPLHAAGKVDSERARHLADTDVPLLFVQGTRDKLADLDRLRPALRPLGERVRLHVIEGGDHSFHVLKRSGRTDEQALDETADAVEDWVHQILA